MLDMGLNLSMLQTNYYNKRDCEMDKVFRGMLWDETEQTVTTLDNLLVVEGKHASCNEELLDFFPDYAGSMRTFGKMVIVMRPDPYKYCGRMRDF